MKTKIEKSEKTIGFIGEKFSPHINEEQKKWFYYKTAAKAFGQRIRGLGRQYSPWRSYEEPLQTSCLGNHWFYNAFLGNIGQKLLVL